MSTILKNVQCRNEGKRITAIFPAGTAHGNLRNTFWTSGWWRPMKRSKAHVLTRDDNTADAEPFAEIRAPRWIKSNVWNA